jgi:CheY-like chemotaxis protein
MQQKKNIATNAPVSQHRQSPVDDDTDALCLKARAMVHDINNILGGIYGYTDLAYENSSEQKVRGYLEKSMKAIDRMKDLTSSFSTMLKSRNAEPLYSEQATASQNSGSTNNEIEKSDTVKAKAENILVMDDEEVLLDVVSSMLKKLHYKYYLAKNGDEAVTIYTKELIKGNRIKFLLLDLIIRNGMGGVDTLAKIKRINPEIKAIAASGYSNDPVLSNPEEYGFNGILKKPFIMSDLSKAIKKAYMG